MESQWSMHCHLNQDWQLNACRCMKQVWACMGLSNGSPVNIDKGRKLWNSIGGRCADLAGLTYLKPGLEGSWKGDIHACLASLQPHAFLFHVLGQSLPPYQSICPYYITNLHSPDAFTGRTGPYHTWISAGGDCWVWHMIIGTLFCHSTQGML